MELSVLFTTSRSAALKLFDGGTYHTCRPYRVSLNGAEPVLADRTITSLYNLKPDTCYEAVVLDGSEQVGAVAFRTQKETVSLDVRRFGAAGDGVHDDTAAIQAAINCCPAGGRVRIPRGNYCITPLFLKSHITIELQQGARLMLCPDRSRFPILPGVTFAPEGDFLLGSWEGNPLDCFASALTGVDVEDVRIIGTGVVDGQAQLGDWWQNPKLRRGAWRPRLLFLCRCRQITVQGLTFCNSPAWNLHPYFSQNLIFADLAINAPASSPNTDGFDPESCRQVTVAGVHFSVGDDCIAIKSGKIYMGARYRTPCEDIDISHCLMENGHGGVTAGSECAGGIRDVRVRYCLMRNTDRGLRVKTRRGRGENAVIDGIVFDHVKMRRVGSPFVVNCLYFCDPDGHSAYVQSREAQPVDHRTPRIGRIAFRNVDAQDCGACAGYFLGLPERPIQSILLENCVFTYAPDAKPFVPAMADGVAECLHQGLIIRYAGQVTLRNVCLTGQQGERLNAEQVESITWEDEA